MFVRVEELLDRNRGLLDAWAGVDWQACDPDAVAVGAAQLLRDADRLRAIGLLAVGEHDRRGGTTRDGDASTGDWLSRQTKSSKAAGARSAKSAKRMRKAPKTAKAAADGRLSSEQADALAGVVTDENAEAFAAQEDELIEQARESLDAAVEAANRFRESTGESPQDRADRLQAARNASTWVGEDGMLQGRQSLAGEDGATFRNAFQAFVDREFRNATTDDPRSPAQRRADAAVEMARYAAAALNGTRPSSRPVPTVTTHIDYRDLLEAAGLGEDENTGLAITGEAARRLACDANIVRLITRGRSETIDVGRKTRTIPVATRRAALARDGGCTYPGCSVPADWVEVHHLRHWIDLGETNLENLTCACKHHHHLAHEGHWNLSLDPATGRTIWKAPDGRILIGQQHRRRTHQHRAA